MSAPSATSARLPATFYLLAALSLVGVLAGIFLSHRLIVLFQESGKIHQSWSEVRTDLSNLAVFADAANTPGNEVFESGDVAGESAKRWAAHQIFEERLLTVREKLRNVAGPERFHAFTSEFQETASASSAASNRAAEVFARFSDDTLGAAAALAAMNRATDRVTASIRRMLHRSRALENQLLAETASHGIALDRLQYLLSALFLALVGATVFYARRLQGSRAAQALERERSTTALRHSEERFRQFAENLGEVLWMTSTNGREVFFVSRAYERVWGRSCESVYADPLERIASIHKDDRQRVTEAIISQAATGDYEEEYRVVRPDGSVRWVRDTGFPIRNEAGEVIRIAGIASDVTERREAATALSGARDESERANRAKSEFLSRMSHELRTPLNAILGFGQLLEMDEPTPRQRESVGQILSGGRHLLGLINEVLDITRIEAGRMSLSPESVNAAAVIEEARALAQPLADQFEVRVEKAPMDCDCHILADRQRLKQVVLNLLSNAIKYNRPRGAITIACHQRAPVNGADGGAFRLVISDTGLGIPPEKLERLFTPFDRLGAETTGIEGSGLGLSLSRKMTELMSGTLTAASVVGQGSTFTVSLPLAESPVEAHQRQHGTPLPPAPGAPMARTVLYIEDNLSNLKLIERLLLLRPGLKLLAATQGQLGLELAREHRPDLILLDLHLPDIMGDEILRRLQLSERTREIPVVVLSADATPRQIARLREAGARDYLTKPLDVPEFLAMLEKLLAPAEGAP